MRATGSTTRIRRGRASLLAGWERDRDQADFEAVVPRLEPERRLWLAQALDRVHRHHPWRAAL